MLVNAEVKAGTWEGGLEAGGRGSGGQRSDLEHRAVK